MAITDTKALKELLDEAGVTTPDSEPESGDEKATDFFGGDFNALMHHAVSMKSTQVAKLRKDYERAPDWVRASLKYREKHGAEWLALPLEERLAFGEKLRLEGNGLLNASGSGEDQWFDALQLYAKALSVFHYFVKMDVKGDELKLVNAMLNGTAVVDSSATVVADDDEVIDEMKDKDKSKTESGIGEEDAAGNGVVDSVSDDVSEDSDEAKQLSDGGDAERDEEEEEEVVVDSRVRDLCMKLWLNAQLCALRLANSPNYDTGVEQRAVLYCHSKITEPLPLGGLGAKHHVKSTLRAAHSYGLLDTSYDLECARDLLADCLKFHKNVIGPKSPQMKSVEESELEAAKKQVESETETAAVFKATDSSLVVSARERDLKQVRKKLHEIRGELKTQKQKDVAQYSGMFAGHKKKGGKKKKKKKNSEGEEVEESEESYVPIYQDYIEETEKAREKKEEEEAEHKAAEELKAAKELEAQTTWDRFWKWNNSFPMNLPIMIIQIVVAIAIQQLMGWYMRRDVSEQ